MSKFNKLLLTISACFLVLPSLLDILNLYVFDSYDTFLRIFITISMIIVMINNHKESYFTIIYLIILVIYNPFKTIDFSEEYVTQLIAGSIITVKLCIIHHRVITRFFIKKKSIFKIISIYLLIILVLSTIICLIFPDTIYSIDPKIIFYKNEVNAIIDNNFNNQLLFYDRNFRGDRFYPISEIIKSKAFKNLSNREKEKVLNEYFEEVISPKIKKYAKNDRIKLKKCYEAITGFPLHID